MNNLLEGDQPIQIQRTSRVSRVHWVIGEGIDVLAFGWLLWEFLEVVAGERVLAYNLGQQRYFCCHRLGWERLSNSISDGLTPLVTYQSFGRFWDWYNEEHLGYCLDGVMVQYLWFVLPSCDILRDLSLEKFRGVHSIWVTAVCSSPYLGSGFTPLVLPRPAFYYEWCEQLRQNGQTLWEGKRDWQTQLQILHWRGQLWRQLKQLILT